VRPRPVGCAAILAAGLVGCYDDAEESPPRVDLSGLEEIRFDRILAGLGPSGVSP